MKKANQITHIVAIVALSICLVSIIATLVRDIVVRALRTWNNNDTIQYVFLGLVVVIAVLVGVEFKNYFLNKDKQLTRLNTIIYRLFESIEKNNKIDVFEKTIVLKQNQKLIDELIKILKLQSESDLDKKVFFTESPSGIFEIEIGNKKVRWIKRFRAIQRLKILKENRSSDFERLFREVHTGEIIKKEKSPLSSIVLPLNVGVIGLFVSLYQLLSVDSFIKDSLMTYLFLFLFTLAFGALLSMWLFRIDKRTMMSKKISAIQTMQDFCEKNHLK